MKRVLKILKIVLYAILFSVFLTVAFPLSIFFGYLIYRNVKPNGKSIPKKWVLPSTALLVVATLGVMISSHEGGAANAQLTADESAIIEENEPEEEIVKEDEVEEDIASLEEAPVEDEFQFDEGVLLQLNLINLNDNFSDMIEWTLNEEMATPVFVGRIIDAEIRQAIISLMINGDSSVVASWESGVVEPMAGLTESMNELGIESVSIMLLNPLNEENVILSIFNGVVLYNVANDL